MVMEYNIAVTIKPKRAKMLAFPIGDRVIFTKGPVFVENPGGMGTTGAFTAAWTSWWGGAGAEQVFNADIKKKLENDLSEKAMARFIRRFKPARRKTVKLSVADNRAAYDTGARMAEEFLQERNRKNLARRKPNGEL
jgi:hypothetical protein